jgi:hypothetical protein
MIMIEDDIYPTAEQCNKNEIVFDDGKTIAHAIWSPNIGGHCGRALAYMDKKWVEYDNGVCHGGCIDLKIYHDGEFPTDGETPPLCVHVCDPDDIIEFGELLKKLNLTGKTEGKR